MKVYLTSDTHFNHDKIKTYCDRPEDFTERIIRNWVATVKDEDLVIHLGDVFIGPADGWHKIVNRLPGRKTLVRGNHDRKHSNSWWMEHGFEFACDGLIFRNAWLTHEPVTGFMPEGTVLNIHGHLHNIWHGFHKNSPEDSVENRAAREQKLYRDYQRLFAIEYTNYFPVEFDKFINHPEKYQATGPTGKA